MSISALRDVVRSELAAFAWDKWAQLGVFAPIERPDRRAMDPEALLLFTFEVGRNDPRLFDEVLDWLLTNEKLVSVQRLRNLSVDDADRDLAEAALAWVARQRPRAGFSASKPQDSPAEPKPLFRTARQSVRNPDPTYLSFGFLKPDTEPSGKSSAPDLSAPINFTSRMRQLFGVGSRAEVFRYLITSLEAAGAQELAESAGYAKRNVNETLAALTAARAVAMYELGNERRYTVNRIQWGQLLELKPESWPTRYEWPRLLLSLRQLARWIENSELDALSDYLLASEARSLMDALEPNLAYAGITLNGSRPHGEAYWSYFEGAVEELLSTVKTAWI
jgi:DNA-binding transcriptional ArsR family regulator